MCPNVLGFVQFHQVSIFEDIACVVIDDDTNEVTGGVREWGDSFQEDVFSCKCIPAMKRRQISVK